MGLLEVLLISVGLAMDAFAVALGVGATRRIHTRRPVFRLSFHFGLFQFLMPVLGWLGGTTVAHLISGVDHWVAFGLLAYVGARMVQSGLSPDAERRLGDPSRGRLLVMLSVATSIDAFAIGLSLAMLRVNILEPSIVIGLVAAGFTWAGLALGGRLSGKFGKRAEVAGGALLIAIGLRILLSHLLPAAGV
jgi:putative Mn2+ efflux pump MntP